ncbi:MAG: DUF853 family protein [Candidatus Wallbacteria bacterium]|nr:DUF853 family protein [Candidatus Wallbacteria bacterium]
MTQNGFFLGLQIKINKLSGEKFILPADDFTRHAFICGSTGTGKTVLGKILIEEAALNGISSIVIDLKGDLSSLAVPVVDMSPEELSPWLKAGRTPSDTAEAAREAAADTRTRLKHFGLTTEDVRELRRKVRFDLYTPRTKRGIKFSISELCSAPDDLDQYQASEPENVSGMIQNMAQSLLGRIFPNANPRDMIVEMGFLEEIIRHLWASKTPLDGIEGLERLIDEIRNPGFKTIGRLNLDEFIAPDIRMQMIKKMNSLLIGTQRSWFEGESIADIVHPLMTSAETRVAIFNLSELESFSDRSLVVSQLAYSVFNTYRRSHSDKLRLLFYIDEIGGTESSGFFPPEPFSSTAKPAVNLLLRQGRAFGVGMVLSTQNPGDIDYKGLTNCHTWFIGKLLTAEDRKKAMEGFSRAEIRIERAEDFVRDAREGCFLVRTKEGKVHQFQERWLLSWHKVLGNEDLDHLRKELRDKNDYLKACQLSHDGDVERSIDLYRELIRRNPAEPGNYLDLSDVLAAGNRAEEALEVLKESVKNGHVSERIMMKMGRVLILLGRYDLAEQHLLKALSTNQSLDEAHYLLARVLRFRKDLDKAAWHAGQAGRLNYQQEEYWHLKAWIMYERGSFQDALTALDNALKIRPLVPAYCQFKALIIFSSGQVKEAGQQLDSCADDGCLTHFLRGLIAESLKKPQERERELLLAADADKNFAPAHFHLGRLYFEKLVLDRALAFVEQALRLDPNEPEYWYQHALIMVRAKLPEKALEDLDKALLAKEDYRFLLLAAELLEQQGSSGKSATFYKRVLAVDQENLRAFTRLADLLMEEDAAQSLALVKKAQEHHSTPELFLLKSRAHLALGYTREALACIDEYLRLNSSADAFAWNLRSAIFRKENNWVEVLANFEKMAKILPETPEIIIGKVEALIKLSRLDDALSLCDTALEDYPEHPGLWQSLSFVYRALDEEEKALYCEERIRKIRSFSQSPS